MGSFQSVFRDKKICVLVPTYNNEQTLASLLSGVLKYTDQVLVVNDGSTDSSSEILKEFPGVDVVSYPGNKGKGFALRQGFMKALSSGYDYAITIDSDGQHFADDLPAFLEGIDRHPGSIIIGRRNMDQAGIPGKSNFGRNFSNFWFRFETGIRLEDTQSGFRLYPLQLLKDISFKTTKFEFEIEVIVRAAWAGIPVVEVPVSVYYPEKTKRISHFRPFRDFTRISILNTVLVAVTLFYIFPKKVVRTFSSWERFRASFRDAFFNTEEGDFVKAASVGFGVFMGIFPIWGFQLAVAIAVAFFLKLNKALVVIAANISIPPMIPLILFVSHITGALWMGDHAVLIPFESTFSMDLLQASLLQYLLGAVTLSIACGVGVTLITHSVLKLLRRKQWS